MQFNRCANCMEEIGGYPCPRCGFDAEKSPQPDYALSRNTILHGKFLIGNVLGQGGFGITYVGWDLALEVKVAIKEYFPAGQMIRQGGVSSHIQWTGRVQSEEARRAGMDSFLKEARKMAKVDKIREVVRVRDTFYENGTAYIIMDFVEGETLKARLEREGPLPFDKAMEIFRPVLTAMEQVHRAGIIHRDLSPDNIMIEPDGGVRILDLGAAKDLAVNRGDSSMLVTKSGFSPLEQYSQRGGSGPWTDVYAMGAAIYYTLTGIVPLNALDRLCEDELRWDLPSLQSLPAPALEALRRALDIIARQRTQSMSELLAGLEAAVPEPKQEPKPEPMPEPETKAEPEPKSEPKTEPLPPPKLKFPQEPEAEPVKSGPGWKSKLQAMPRKKLLGIAGICAVLVIAAAMGLAVLISQSWKAGPSITWKFDSGVMTLSGSGEMYNYGRYENTPPWRGHRDDITSVIVGPGVTCIGEHAFSSCTQLTDISISDSVTEIGSAAFYDCSSLTGITIPEGVTKIESGAFEKCSSLTDITIPEGVTRIRISTFQGCSSLTDTTIPEGVTVIEPYAFYDCSSLTGITIPEGVTEIEVSAFGNCSSLTDIYYAGTEEQWEDILIDDYGNDALLYANIHYNS